MEAPKSYKEVQRFAGQGVVSSVLIREEAKVHNPIYYVSHVLHGPEENYPQTDKFIMALVISARKLKAYFEAHPIVVVTEQPGKVIKHTWHGIYLMKYYV
ncbi:hypothetical protein LIER_41248 [Lithospermum erythrorhizon]|uniref:Reverse transcriptase RNase H-like domain-containing protein n=1 Tax=Lithospermum erythrorhizon TaxID=34254 RepID=A0AAV3R6L2_LITER